MACSVCLGLGSPCPQCGPPEEEECPECGGSGWIEAMGMEHDPRCDGTCKVGCPVPVQVQEQCDLCAGQGWRKRG